MNRELLNKYTELYKKDLFEKVIPFWYEHGLDKENGGMDTCLTREGIVYSDEKSVWMQGRAGWTFSFIAKELEDDPRLREMAKSSLDFAKDFCTDRDGRMFFLVYRDGRPIRKRRYNASEKTYIRASAEYYGLTGDEKYLDEARRVFDLVMTIEKDSSKDPYKVTPKYVPGSLPRSRGLCPSFVMLETAMCMKHNDPERANYYDSIARESFDNIFKYQWNEEHGILLESVGINGEYLGDLSSGRTVLPGHCLEAIWTLLDAAEDFDCLDEKLVDIEKYYDATYKYGWDDEYGGFLYFVDAEGYPPQAYEHDMKLWWVHTEGVISALKLYRITGKQKYWDDFERLHRYCFDHFRDEQYGEWYGYLRRDGRPTLPVCKGNVFKGPLHVPRMYAVALLEFRRIAKKG